MTSRQKKAQGKRMKANWKDPVFRAKMLKAYKRRSKNENWKSHRARIAIMGASSLHGKHRSRYLEGQKKHSRTMLIMFQDVKFRNKHKRNLRKAVVGNKDRASKIGIATKRRWEKGEITIPPCRWKGPSKLETKVVTALCKAGFKIDAQYCVPTTRYVADAFISNKNCIVEIDGHPSHYNDTRIIRHGHKRDIILKHLGYKVLHLQTKSLNRGVDFCTSRVKAFIARYCNTKTEAA